MAESGLAAALVPAALIVLMLGLGLSLRLSDFGRVFGTPRALAVGLGGQLLLLPVLGVLVVRIYGLESSFALGILVLTLSPGGALSNVVSGLMGADLALSVSLTALSSVATPFSIPILYGRMATVWSGTHPALHLPVDVTMARLLTVSVLPIFLGMATRRSLGPRATALERRVRVLSVALFLAVIGLITAQNAGALREGLGQLGAPVVALDVGATVLGLVLARAARLPASASVTIAIEVGLQNVATATFVALTLLHDPRMALPPAVYALVALPVALGAGAVGRRWIKVESLAHGVSLSARPDAPTATGGPGR